MRQTLSTAVSSEHIENAEGFFMKTGKLHRAALELARRLDEERHPLCHCRRDGPQRPRLRTHDNRRGHTADA